MKYYVRLDIHSSHQQRKRNAAGPAPDTIGETVEKAPRIQMWRIPPRSFSLFWIVLAVVTIILASGSIPPNRSQPHVTGNGGMTATTPLCGPPLQIVNHFGITDQLGQPYTLSTLPTSIQFATLPRPTAGSQISYAPQTNTLCTVSAVVLQSALFSLNFSIIPTPTATISTPSGSAPPAFQTSSTNFWSQGALDALSGVWTGFYHWAGQAIQYVEDWATATLGFMWNTPAALTYKNEVVKTGVSWMLGLMDGLLMLLLVLGGYQCLIRTVLGEPRREVLAFLFRLLIAAVIANFGTLYVIPQLIELNNTLCTGSLEVLVHAGAGNFSVPFLGGVNWLDQPVSWSLFLLVDFIVALLLSLVMLVRLALFLLCYILAPIGILLLGSDSLHSWGQIWCRLFFFSLFIQFLQVLVVAIGSAFTISFFTVGSEGSLSPTTLFVGIATLYLAFKLPQLLMQPVLGGVYGDMQQGASMIGTLLALLAA